MVRLLRLLLLLISCFATAGLSACQKQIPAPDLTSGLQLEGRWELTHTSGGFTGRTFPADSTQKREIMFQPNGQALFFLNGAITTSATFTLTQAVAANTNRTETFVTYGAPAATLPQFLAELSATTLVIADDHPDGFSATYRRVSLAWCGTR